MCIGDIHVDVCLLITSPLRLPLTKWMCLSEAISTSVLSVEFTGRVKCTVAVPSSMVPTVLVTLL